jgi:hypothetical protein
VKSSVSFARLSTSTVSCLRLTTRSNPLLLCSSRFLSSNVLSDTETRFLGSPRMLIASRRVGSWRRFSENLRLSTPKSRDSLAYARTRAQARAHASVLGCFLVSAERGSDNAGNADREARSRAPCCDGAQARHRARRDASAWQSTSFSRALVSLRRRTDRHCAHTRVDAALGWEMSTSSQRVR